MQWMEKDRRFLGEMDRSNEMLILVNLVGVIL